MATVPTQRQLRTFCLLFAILFLCFAIPIALLRYLIAQGAAPGETVPPLLLAQELACAMLLVVLAAVLLWVRGRLRTPRFRQVIGAARTITIIAAVVCVAGLCVVIMVPLSGEVTAGKFPTIAASALTLISVFFVYSGLPRLPR